MLACRHVPAKAYTSVAGVPVRFLPCSSAAMNAVVPAGVEVGYMDWIPACWTTLARPVDCAQAFSVRTGMYCCS
jgi:hypothetical protein